MRQLTILEYLDRSGSSPFVDWFATLDATAAAKVTIATRRLELGNFSNVKGVGGGVFEYRVDFGPGYRVFSARMASRSSSCSAAGRRNVRTVTSRALTSDGPITRSERRRRSDMPLTREFKETVQARIKADRKYRKELLREGVECLLAGDLDTGKAILRDYINATIGFEELSRRTKRPAKSLMRMLGPSGNPQARNLFEVIGHLQRAEGLHFELSLKAAS
jgi:putative addiction module killer protein